MKRTALLRSRPLKRRGPLRATRLQRRPARRIAKRVADRPYVAFIHTLPCCAELGVENREHGYRESMCGGRIEANHAGEKPGMGLKAPDSTCIPMCSAHHRDWTEHRGLFRFWTREERRAWADEQIRRTKLAATPDNRIAAYTFEAIGLGTWDESSDSWMPSWGRTP